MYLKQIYTGCLSEAAYFVESNGEAIIIDPLRDTEEYLSLAKQHNAKINREGYEESLDEIKTKGLIPLSVRDFKLKILDERPVLAMDIPYDNNLVIVDVRNENEFAGGHVKDAINLPLNEMTDVAQIAQLEENQNIYVHSESGYRSLIAASLLKRHGYNNFRNVVGGWAKIKEQKNIKTEKEAGISN